MNRLVNRPNRFSISKLINDKITTIDEQLCKDESTRLLNSKNLSFFHSNTGQFGSERILVNFKSTNKKETQPGLFLIRSDNNSNDFFLSIYFNNKIYHFRIENISDDCYFRLSDGSLIHGLDTLVDELTRNKRFLPCKLKNFVPGECPPDWSLKFGFTNLLHKLSIEGSVNLLSRLLKHEKCPSIDSKDSYGNTAVHVACLTGNLAILEILLKAGANPNMKDKDGNTSLHLACTGNHPELFELLINTYGSEINSRNPLNYWTPLHAAASNDSVDAIQSLITEYGAILNLQSKSNETPSDIARLNKSIESIKLLKLLTTGVSGCNQEDWFHENASYTEAIALLDSVGQIDGLFLIIKNHQERNNFYLLFYYEGRLNTFEIAHSPKGYQIGMDPFFKRLEILVESYCKNKYNLPCTLKKSLNKNGVIVSEVVKKIQYFEKVPYTNLNFDINIKPVVNRQSFPIPSRNNPKRHSLSSSDSDMNHFVNCSSFKRDESSPCLFRSFEEISLTKNHAKSDSSEIPMIPPTNIRILSKIGEGEFGNVYHGNLIDQRGVSTGVAIKHLKYGGNFQDFLREAKIMGTLNHKCIVQVQGICYERQMIALELVKLGSLNNYLRKHALELRNDSLKLWSYQIADGMAYLESKKLVHRDLACRNVLVASTNQVKITDFGMTRKLESYQIYLQNPCSKIPFRWYPIESMENNLFTSKSDVWSYGVTIWEIYSLGEMPYSKLNFNQVMHLLRMGSRLSRPPMCPQLLYNLIIKCWSARADMRPSFIDILEFFNLNYEFI